MFPQNVVLNRVGGIVEDDSVDGFPSGSIGCEGSGHLIRFDQPQVELDVRRQSFIVDEDGKCLSVSCARHPQRTELLSQATGFGPSHELRLDPSIGFGILGQ